MAACAPLPTQRIKSVSTSPSNDIETIDNMMGAASFITSDMRAGRVDISLSSGDISLFKKSLLSPKTKKCVSSQTRNAPRFSQCGCFVKRMRRFSLLTLPGLQLKSLTCDFGCASRGGRSRNKEHFYEK